MYGKKEEKNKITKRITAVCLSAAAMAVTGWTALMGLSGCGSESGAVFETVSLSDSQGSGGPANDGQKHVPENGSGKNRQEETEVGTDLQEADLEISVTERIQVHVCGAVKTPGVYELPAGSRVFEAVEAAGGMEEDAAADYLNLADAVLDGAKVRVPFLSELSESERYGPSGNFGVTGSQETSSETNGLVDLNHADEAALMGLPGIGEAKAEAIISWREEHGPFGAPEDIMQVPGIKKAAYEKLKDKVTVKN